MKTKILAGLLLTALALSPVFAQSAESYQAGAIFAKNFAYGFGNAGPIRIINGPYSTGTVTFVVDYGRTTTGDGITFYPLSTNAPVLVCAGSNQENLRRPKCPPDSHRRSRSVDCWRYLVRLRRGTLLLALCMRGAAIEASLFSEWD